jgi:hypothetical protein
MNRRDTKLELATVRTMPAAATLLRLLGLACAMALGFLGTGVQGQEAAPVEIVGVEVGIAGHYKPGLWTPVKVVLRGREACAGRVALSVRDSEGVPTRVTTPDDCPVRLVPGRETATVLHARFGRVKSELTVAFEASDGTGARRTFWAGGTPAFPPALASHRELIVVVGADPSGIEAASLLQERAEDRAAVVSVSGFAQLPDRWYGFEGIDVVVLASSRPEAFQALRRDSPQVAALDQWVRLGGRLVLTLGRQADAVLGERAALAGFVPGRFERVLPLRQAIALETFAGGGAPMPRLGAGDRLDLRVPLLVDVQGRIESREGNLPLVVRCSRGFGEIVFAAVELDDPTLRAWRDRGQFVRRLLGAADRLAGGPSESAAVLHYGFDDLSGQLRSALDQYPDVPLVSFSMVMGLLVVYLVLVGPADYFFLRKVTGRMTLTWITFPLVVVAFCAGTYVLASRLKGDQVRVHQVDLVDVDSTTGLLRGTSWATVFSPVADQYDLAFEPQMPAAGQRPSVLVAWFGLPGSGLGGMDPKTSPPLAWTQGYAFSPELDRLVGVPIPTWSTRSLTARWTAQASVPVEASLREEERALTGKVLNRSGITLADALLCHGGWAYELGTLAPGDGVVLDRASARRDLRTFLTGQRYVVKEGRQLPTPYDRSSSDTTYILRAMMFYRAAGGRQFTGLHHRYQAFVDASDLLRAGNAVLVAQAGGGPHGARWLRDGQALGSPDDLHCTVYRFVFPVPEGSEKP